MTNVFDLRVSIDDPNERIAAQSAPDATIETTSDDASQTPADIRSVVQELLKHGYIEESDREKLFRRIITAEKQISAILEPLDLGIRLDSHRGIALLVIVRDQTQECCDEQGWTHPLVRRQRLTLEQSLLVAILRQIFALHEQERGVGQCAAVIAVDQLVPQCMAYFGDSGSDSRNENRILQLLEQLKPHGIVSTVDKNREVTISPLVAHLADPSSLLALLEVLKGKQKLAMSSDVQDNHHDAEPL